MNTTYWMTVKTPRGRVRRAIIVDDAAALRLVGNLDPTWEIEDLSPLDRCAPCSTCPVRDRCVSSRWSTAREGNRPSQDSVLSVVTECRTCLTPSLITFQTGTGTKEVPPNCPRLASPGRSPNCDHCNKALMDLLRTHPRYDEKMKAAKSALRAVLEGEKLPTWEDIPQVQGISTRAYTFVSSTLHDLDMEKEFASPWAVEADRVRAALELIEWVDLFMTPLASPGEILSKYLLILVAMLSERWADLPLTRRRALSEAWERRMHLYRDDAAVVIEA